MLAIIFANQKNASILVLADSISSGKVSRCAQSKGDLFHSSYGVTVKGDPRCSLGFQTTLPPGKLRHKLKLN